MQQPLNDTVHTKEPQEKPNFFTETKNLFQSYLGDRMTLVKLQIVEKVSVMAAAVISGVLLLVFVLYFLMFFSFAAGYFFGHLVHSNAWGFAIVAGIYFLLILIVIFFGKKLFGNAITHKLIQGFLKKK